MTCQMTRGVWNLEAHKVEGAFVHNCYASRLPDYALFSIQPVRNSLFYRLHFTKLLFQHLNLIKYSTPNSMDIEAYH
jgi:hypothetical protein